LLTKLERMALSKEETIPHFITSSRAICGMS
jgi:hypothetical protein